MILVFDIGNSNITLGGFTTDSPDFVARIKTDTQKTADEYAVNVVEILRLYGIDISTLSFISMTTSAISLGGVEAPAVMHTSSVS